MNKITSRLLKAWAKRCGAVSFDGFNNVQYRGNLVSFNNGVAKVVYMLATAIPNDKAEGGTAIAYLDKYQWHRIHLA